MQLQAIPGLLSRRDAIVGAQTGTGKTASFALPLLQLLATESPSRRHIRALILTPTRELAAQVEQSIRSYGRYLRLRSTAVFGGVSINPQIQTLREGVDILVATPGRLLDHVRGKTVDLRQVEFLVLDEADRMLDMGFIRDIRRIFEALPAQRQNLFFSATYSPEIRQFADSFLNAPLEIAVSRKQATADLIRQVVHPVDKGGKRALLSWLIGSGDWRQVLVFTRTKHGANRLAEQLVRDGISATAIHGNKSQGARTRALAEFKQGTVRVLVATDIAARGLDIKELPHVVNFELPNVPEDYVHRIGRTGRAGSNGIATSLVCRDEKSLLGDIERLIRLRIESVVVPGFEPGSQSATDEHEEPHTRRAGAKPAQRGQASATQRRQEDGRANRNSRPSERTEHDSAGQRRAADGQPWHARQGKHRSGTGKQDHGNSNGGRRTADNRSAKNAGMKREWSGS